MERAQRAMKSSGSAGHHHSYTPIFYLLSHISIYVEGIG